MCIMQDAFVFAQAELAAALRQEPDKNILLSRCAFEHIRVQIKHFLRVAGTNVEIAIPIARFWPRQEPDPWVPRQRGAVLTGLDHLTC